MGHNQIKKTIIEEFEEKFISAVGGSLVWNDDIRPPEVKPYVIEFIADSLDRYLDEVERGVGGEIAFKEKFVDKVYKWTVGIIGQYSKSIKEMTELQQVDLQRQVEQLSNGVIYEAVNQLKSNFKKWRGK